jgi:hypothetical protein
MQPQLNSSPLRPPGDQQYRISGNAQKKIFFSNFPEGPNASPGGPAPPPGECLNETMNACDSTRITRECCIANFRRNEAYDLCLNSNSSVSVFIFSVFFFCSIIRPIPPRELVAVVDFLRHLLSCDVDKLPVDALVHPYFHMRRNEMLSLLFYESCLNNVHLTKEAVLDCYERLPGLCSLRFGIHGPDALELCHRLLHQANESFHPRFIRQLDNFTECISKCRERVNDLCSPLLKSACSSRRLRVAKVVRASMESMELLLRTLPGSKVIHLVRDPRAVALSRYVFTPSTRGHTWNIARDKTEKLATEASIYCRRVVADVRWRHLLEQRFPDRLLSLTYEDLVSDPIKQAIDIYGFIKDVDVPAKAVYMFAYLAKVGRRNMSAVDLASKWRRELKPSELKQINEKCKELIRLYPQYAEIDVSRPDDDET